MNYRHGYHAGSFTDVIKHVTLVALLNSMQRKDTPFCYIDTHAGMGCYDFNSGFGIKNKEYQNGIEKIIQQKDPPPLVKQYLSYVHQINNRLTQSSYSSLQFYPGSPLIARQMLRPHDRMIACELHPEEYQSLKSTLGHDRQVALHHSDGFLALKAFLPPVEKRGVILIDPPYEDPDEFTRIVHSLTPALKRFEPGIFAIWYPIKEQAHVDRFHRAITHTFSQEVLAIELTIYPDLPQHLNGCGMAVINPPWQFEQTIQNVIPWLWKTLTINGQGAYSTQILK